MLMHVQVYPKEWRDLVRGLLSRDPEDRPRLADVLQAPFLARAGEDIDDAFREAGDATTPLRPMHHTLRSEP
jgi:serine/threonine protein kinase